MGLLEPAAKPSANTMPADTADTGRAAINDFRDALRTLLGAERRLRRRSQRGQGEVSYAQLLTLAVVARTPGLTAGEVARRAGLDPGSLTPVLDQLAALGAIELTRNPENRRAYVICMTGDGHQLAMPLLTNWLSRWNDGLSGFSDAELGVASRVMVAVASIFEGTGRGDEGGYGESQGA